MFDEKTICRIDSRCGNVDEEWVIGSVAQKAVNVSGVISPHVQQWGNSASPITFQVYECLNIIESHSD